MSNQAFELSRPAVSSATYGMYTAMYMYTETYNVPNGICTPNGISYMLYRTVKYVYRTVNPICYTERNILLRSICYTERYMYTERYILYEACYTERYILPGICYAEGYMYMYTKRYVLYVIPNGISSHRLASRR